MKWIITICSILCFYSNTLAQHAKDLNISIHGRHTNYLDHSTNGIGFHAEYFLWDNLSVNYEATLGWTSDLNFHINTSVGMALGVYLVADENIFISETISTIAFFSIIVPKGISIYVPVKENKFYLATFINPLGFDYFGKDENDESIVKFSGDAGIKAIIKLKRHFSIVPYLGGKLLYSNSDKGVFGGVHLQWHID